VLVVPADVSVTVTVHVDPWLITTGLVQLTVVVVTRLLTVSEAVAEPVPALFVAETVTVKTPFTAYVWVADVAVPGSETTAVPSPQFTVILVGVFVAEKVTVTT